MAGAGKCGKLGIGDAVPGGDEYAGDETANGSSGSSVGIAAVPITSSHSTRKANALSALQTFRNGRRLPWRSVKRPLQTRITMAPVCTAARLVLVTHVPMPAKSCRKTEAKVSTATCGKQSSRMALEMRQTSMLRKGAGPVVAAAA